MAAFVVDASVAATWFLPDEQSDLAEAALNIVTRSSALAPDLFLHELRSILVISEKRGRITVDDIHTSLTRFRQLRIRLSNVSDDTMVVTLAHKHQISAYDAAYLALAITNDVPLATLDKKLRRAAEAEPVPLFEA